MTATNNKLQLYMKNAYMLVFNFGNEGTTTRPNKHNFRNLRIIFIFLQTSYEI